MEQLRNLSPRPELVVDNNGDRVGLIPDRIGIPGPFGRGRIVEALPTNKSGGGPQKISSAVAVHDNASGYLADPDGNLIGEANAVWVHRLLTATVTADTRRL